MKNALQTWTGERLETFVQNKNTIEHLHRYAFVFNYIQGKTVLDIASGEGYGSKLMALHAKNVTGIDISPEAITNASQKYTAPNLSFRVGSVSEMPVEDHSIDVLVSFETLEHHDQHEKMLSEIKRVLKKNGVMVMSTPDKKNYTDRTGYNNPFHIKELYTSQFRQLINSNFENCVFYKQQIVNGSLIIPDGNSTSFSFYKGDYSSINQNKDFFPLYDICVCSDTEIKYAETSIFDGSDILEKKFLADMEKHFQSSWKYRIGNAILSPLKLFTRK